MSPIKNLYNIIKERIVEYKLQREKERQLQLENHKNEIKKKIDESKEVINAATKALQDTEVDLEKKLIAEYLLIDSNIWMDEDYTKFFGFLLNLLKKNKIGLEMPNIQFDEIVNIKKKTTFGQPKNAKARIALSRIEDFQKERCLKIVPLQLESKPGAYADPELLKILIHLGKKYQSLVFISNDKELRIRARQFVDTECETNFIALGDSDIKTPFLTISSAKHEIYEAEKTVKKLQEELANWSTQAT